MPAFEAAQKLLERITYKPGWEFKLEYGRDVWRLLVTYPAPDATDDFLRPVTIASTRDIMPECAIDSWFEHEVVLAIRTAEAHERDEWLKFDGEYVNHPHPEDS